MKTLTTLLFIFLSMTTLSFGQSGNSRAFVNTGDLTNYFMIFTNGSVDANWQGASKGFVGDVVINGKSLNERTSGTVPYSGTIYTNDSILSAWEEIISDNSSQASASYNNTQLVTDLTKDLDSVFTQINALNATNGFSSISAGDLDNLNTKNGQGETYVINITSGFDVKIQIDITGDASDLFILRWDTDSVFSNGYQGKVKFSSGGSIVPHGDLSPANFLHVAGDINASGGGSTPSSPFPQGPRFSDGTGALVDGGQDFSGGGFFTGYWFTTGEPTIFPTNGSQPYGKTSSLSNAIFVGGWYSITSQFSMTSGTSGVYISNTTTVPVTWLDLSAKKLDNGVVNITWSTASEENNHYFTIERSEDGVNFSPIGEISGAGNSVTVSHYEFNDYDLSSSNLIHYRIKQTDFDGNFDHSDVVTINNAKSTPLVLQYDERTNVVSIKLPYKSAMGILVKLTDMSGKQINGKLIDAGSQAISFSTSELPNGIYVVSLLDAHGDIMNSQKMVVH